MSNIALTVQSEELNKLVAEAEALGEGMSGPDIKLAAGAAMKEAIREHFFALASDTAHHETAESLGASRTGFYLEAGDATHDPQLENEGVSVSIEKEGLAQRYFGGTISAKPGSWLTIPARAEYYGERAKDQADLQFILFPSGLAALIDKNDPAHEGSVYYWLVRSVTQPEDKSVLPTDAEILDPAVEQARRYLETVVERRAP